MPDGSPPTRRSRFNRSLMEWAIGLSLVFALIAVGATQVMAVIAIVTVAVLLVKLVTWRR